MKTLAKKTNDVNNNLSALPDVKRLKEFIKIEQEKRELLKEYIAKNLIEGVDYGIIEIESKNTGKKYKSKPTLFKAGSEKFLSLMHLKAVFKRDDETWEMAGKQPGLFCYICHLVDSKGNVVGEGRGSCHINEKKSANEAIKLAEKRAQLDAVLRTGGLSDFFTQDLEDHPDAVVVKPEPKATARQLNLIYQMLPNRGKTPTDVCRAYKIEKLEDLTMKQASNVIKRLQKMPPVKAQVVKETKERMEAENIEEVDIDEVDRGIEEMKNINN